MEGPISFWGYKEQEKHLILHEHDDDKSQVQRRQSNIDNCRPVSVITDTLDSNHDKANNHGSH